MLVNGRTCGLSVKILTIKSRYRRGYEIKIKIRVFKTSSKRDGRLERQFFVEEKRDKDTLLPVI